MGNNQKITSLQSQLDSIKAQIKTERQLQADYEKTFQGKLEKQIDKITSQLATLGIEKQSKIEAIHDEIGTGAPQAQFDSMAKLAGIPAIDKKLTKLKTELESLQSMPLDVFASSHIDSKNKRVSDCHNSLAKAKDQLAEVTEQAKLEGFEDLLPSEAFNKLSHKQKSKVAFVLKREGLRQCDFGVTYRVEWHGKKFEIIK